MADRCQLLRVDVERGPNWLFVKLLKGKSQAADHSTVADQLWAVPARHFIYRMVLELEDSTQLDASMVEQLDLLHDRLAEHGGSLRPCGLSPRAESLLEKCSGTNLRNHSCRSAAVLGAEPAHTTVPASHTSMVSSRIY